MLSVSRFNDCKVAVAEGHGAVFEQRLEYPVALVVAVDLVQDAVDGRVVVLKDDRLLVRCCRN